MSRIVEIKAVPLELMIKANQAVAKGPRGQDAMITVVGALHKDHTPDDIHAVISRLQALAVTVEGADMPELSMSLHGKVYKLVNEAAFAAAASCRLVHSADKTIGEIGFDKDEFLKSALAFIPERGTA